MFVDSLLAFQLDEKNIRGRLARLGPSLNDILKNHQYPNKVCLLLSEITLLTALIGEMIKLRWRLSLQIRGDGPVKLLATDYFSPNKKKTPATIRAYADFDKTNDFSKETIPSDLIGKGFFSIIIDQGKNTEPYKGITQIVRGDLSKSAENYFFQSEQISTLFSLNISKNNKSGKTTEWEAAGFMLQELPNSEEKKMGFKKENMKNFQNDMKNSLRDLLNQFDYDEDQLLTDIFKTNDITVFDPKTIKFGCSCKKDKLLATLKRHSSKELSMMQDSKGIIKADCQFCGKVYRLNLTN